ncbi:MAG TPA: Spy/CpxP family protein refolding chaperone [Myxococcaceae bacterium]|nr:Spy/CpxP family protein refolding chaperone [Myxococcaceae bacterium]
MNRKWIIGLVAGAVVLGAGVALAASASRGPERARQFINWRVDDALDELDATDTQRAKAHALKDRLFDEALKLRTSKEQVHTVLVDQWRSDRPDGAAVHREVDRIADEFRAFAHQAADAALELHQTLTPEQRAELLQRAEQHRGRHRR